MKVLYVVEPRSVIGGGVRAAANLADHALKQGLLEHAAVFGVWDRAGFDGAGASCALIPFSGTRPRPLSWRFFDQLSKAIREREPDVVHVLGLATALMTQVVRTVWSLDVRIVITVHRVTTDMRGGPLKGLLARTIASRVDGATFLTDVQQRHYASMLGFRPPEPLVLPNVVVTPDVPPEEAASLRSRQQEELDADRLVGFVGRIIPDKQLDVFIRTLRLCRHAGQRVGGVIVGSGPQDHLDHLQRLVRDLDAEDYIMFTGYVNDPQRYIVALDAVLFPTRREALPNLVIEAFKGGVPIVTSAIPQLDSIVAHERDALVVQEDDPAAYAAELSRLLEDEDLASRLASGGREKYRASYDPDVVTSAYIRLYERVVAGHGR